MYKITDGVTQSLLSAWVNCRQYARFYLQGWEQDYPKRALQLGSLMHNALEGWHGEKKQKLPAKLWRAKALKDGDDAQAIENDISTVSVLLKGYIDKWQKKDKKKKFKRVEGLFDEKWRGFRLRGKVDGVYEIGKKLWLLETKTTSRIDEAALKTYLQIDFQSLFYILAMEQVLDRPIAGVMYNLIRKPQLKMGNALPKLHWNRVAEDIASRPAFYYVRLETRMTRSRIAMFEMQLHEKLRDFRFWANDALPTYRNESACRSPWTCRYLKACGDNCMTGYKKTGKLFSELEDE